MPTPQQIARIEKLIAQGRTRFILVYGVLLFGLSFFVLRTLLYVAAGGFSLKVIAIRAIACAIGGAIFGFVMWLLVSWQHRNLKQAGR
jgi:hypothetical protein